MNSLDLIKGSSVSFSLTSKSFTTIPLNKLIFISPKLTLRFSDFSAASVTNDFIRSSVRYDFMNKEMPMTVIAKTEMTIIKTFIVLLMIYLWN